jgi:hypothetical protein
MDVSELKRSVIPKVSTTKATAQERDYVILTTAVITSPLLCKTGNQNSKLTYLDITHLGITHLDNTNRDKKDKPILITMKDSKDVLYHLSTFAQNEQRLHEQFEERTQMMQEITQHLERILGPTQQQTYHDITTTMKEIKPTAPNMH